MLFRILENASFLAPHHRIQKKRIVVDGMIPKETYKNSSYVSYRNEFFDKSSSKMFIYARIAGHLWIVCNTVFNSLEVFASL